LQLFKLFADALELKINVRKIIPKNLFMINYITVPVV
jgi:hypothetical protein